jgi:hypothetical protein
LAYDADLKKGGTLPLVRGHFIPEIGGSGRVKQSLDVLLYAEKIKDSTLHAIGELEQLRIYLAPLNPPVCSIRLFLPADHLETRRALERVGIEALPVGMSDRIELAPKQFAELLKDHPLKGLAISGLNCDADCVAVDDLGLLSNVEDFARAGMLLTSTDFLLRYAEVFVRGHDVPWAFAHKVWFEPWTAFYQISESWTFKPAMEIFALTQAKGAPDAVELVRSLALNRLGDLCFTRDRLCYYEMQQLVAKRSQWKRQRFAAEVAYYLNFYYVLLYGAFDHAASFVNSLFNVGIKERYASARNPEFLKALSFKLPILHAVFENPRHVTFVQRIAALRHLALTPTRVVQELNPPPTNDELDQDIREAGLDALLTWRPPGPHRDAFQEMLRSNARAARYERGTIMEDVVKIEIDGITSLINPLGDTWWNFRCCLSFLNDVFSACVKAKA